MYNPAALKAAQKTLLVSTAAVDNNEAQKKKQVNTVSWAQNLHLGMLFYACMCFFKDLSQNRAKRKVYVDCHWTFSFHCVAVNINLGGGMTSSPDWS